MRRSGLVVSITKARAGQGAEIGKAVLGYLDDLYRFALRLTRDPDHASDLVQDCALRALEWQNTVVRGPRRWLFQTLYHAYVDHCRKSVLRGTYHEDSLGEGMEGESLVDPLPSVIAREDVRNAVESLPEHYRAVVWLSDAEELPIREIAEILGCPLGTAASRLARGRQELRRLLSAYGRLEEK